MFRKCRRTNDQTQFVVGRSRDRADHKILEKKKKPSLLFFEEIANDEVKDGRIQPELPNRTEDKCQDEDPDGHIRNRSRYLDEEKLAFVQNYLERAEDAHSVKTETSDSGMETRSAPSEFEMEERNGKAAVLLLDGFVFTVLAACYFSLHLILLRGEKHSVILTTPVLSMSGAVSALNTHGKSCEQWLAEVETTRCHYLYKECIL